MNLKEWARVPGVHPVPAYRWFREGTLPVPAHKVGRLILVEPAEEALQRVRVVAYCRVSGADQKDDLERQSGRRIVVLDATETTDDLVGDVAEVLTLLCARRYGRRSASPWVAKAVVVATGVEPV